MNAYEFGIRRALADAGLTKEAAGLGWPLAAGGAALLGAGAGALASEDKKRGALIGALGGLGAIGGARYGTGRLTKLYKNIYNVEARRGLAPGAHLKKLMQNPNVAGWINKRVGAGAALGLGGLGAGIGLGSRFVPPSETSGGSGELFGLTPERASHLQDLMPVVQQLYQASQGQAPLPSLAAYSTFPEHQKLSSILGNIARAGAKSISQGEIRDILGVETPEWKRLSPFTLAVDAAKDVVEAISGKEELESAPVAATGETTPAPIPEALLEKKLE